MKNKTAFITGATSGIGMATAKLFAKNGMRLILCGRREDRLKRLSEELSVLTEVHTLRFDVRNKEAVFSAIDSLPEHFSEIDILTPNDAQIVKFSVTKSYFSSNLELFSPKGRKI